MALNIGRKGWIGVGLQTGFQVPAAIADYVDFTSNTLAGAVTQLDIDHATSLREKLNSSILGQESSAGEIDIYADSTKTGYFLASTFGTVQAFSLGSGVFRHVFTRNNSNTPQYMTITNDRAVDRQLYADVCVDQFEFNVGTDMATAKAKLIGNFPQTTTSGNKTTASGNIFSFANAAFAFAATISGAQSAPALKPHDFTLKINNNASAVFAHSTNTPRSINFGDFEASADMTLYFENTTDRDAYYNQNKQAASLVLTGNGIGGGFNESLTFNFYKTSFNTFALETGIDKFYAEKANLQFEYDTAAQRSVDAVLVNTKTLYI